MLERLAVQEAAADLLSRPRLQGLMAALIDQDCTMAELASRSGMSYSLLSHHLRRMVSLGLVREVSRTPRAGARNRRLPAEMLGFRRRTTRAPLSTSLPWTPTTSRARRRPSNFFTS